MYRAFKKIVSFILAASICTTGGVFSTVCAEDEVTTEANAVVTDTADDETDGFLSGYVNEKGMHALYDYAYWNSDGGRVKMTPQIRGGYDCYWEDIDDALFMTGELYERKKGDNVTLVGSPATEYRAVMDPDTDYFFGAYGWFTEPNVEFFIIDDWGVNTPTFSTDPIGRVEADGGTYNIYKKMMLVQPGLTSGVPMYSYYIVRTEKRSADSNIIEGKISIGKHFEALKKLGVKLGYVYEIMLAVEAYRSSGSAHILKNDYYTEVSNEDLDLLINPNYDPDEVPPLPDDGVDVLHDTVFNDLVSDERDGYYFNLFKDANFDTENDLSKLELLNGGAFKCEWNNPGRVTFERGIQYYNSENSTRSVVRKYNNEDITIEYGAELESDGPMWAGGYGWLNTLGIEYYIVEAWKDWHISDDAVQLGVVRLSDDVIYDLYEVPNNGFFSQIWSVRRDNQLGEDGKIEGKINFNDHFYTWEKYAFDVVDPDFVTFAVCGSQSSGKAEVYKNVLKIDGEDIYIPSENSEENKPAPKYVPGDLNGDLIVNSFDVIIARRELIKAVNGENTIEEVDIDCNGSTKINDLVLITKIALGDKVEVPKARPNRK